MSGYEKVPTDLSLDTSLSAGARSTYPVLLALAWRAGRHADEEVELPPLPEIAAAAGFGQTALKDYLAELRSSGWLTTIRASRARPQRYVIRSVRESESDSPAASCGSDSDSRVSRNPADSRARLNGEPQTKEPDRGDSVSSTTAPPRVALVDGRNLAFDALAAACGYDPGRRQDAAEVAVALNGSRKTGEGIRAELWREDAAAGWRSDELAAANPEGWERRVAAVVEERAALYRRKMPGATLTPTALAKWWGRLPSMPDPAGHRITSTDILGRRR